jgi:hypothetical protein
MLLACEIMFREFCVAAAQCNNIIYVSFLEKALHNIGSENMFKYLQKEIDKIDCSRFDAILLGYGLCNNGVLGLTASIPIVIPKAHDCITLFLGSKERYKSYFDKNPGAYYHTSGWLERDDIEMDIDGSISQQMGLSMSREQIAEQYGEENVDFLMETLFNLTPNYTKATFINMGIGTIDYDREFTRQKAINNNWEYEELDGDMRLINRLLNDEWNEDEFQIIPPGLTIKASYDESIICLCEVYDN